MKPSRLFAAALLSATAISLGACVHAPAVPLDPAVTAARLEARSLNDKEVAAALAQAGTEGRGWTLDDLVIAAWTLRSDVALARADVAAATAAERTAGELPNPTLSIDPSYLVDNVTNNLSPWTVAAALGFTIETGGKRGIRSAQALADTEARRWQLAETLWKVRAEIRAALVARTLAEDTLKLAESEAALRQSFSTWAENAFRYGSIGQPERLNAMVNLAQSQAALRTARGEAAAADAALAAAVGVTAARFPFNEIAGPDLRAIPDPASTDLAALRHQALVNRLSVRRALADYDISEQSLRMAVAKQYPDISFGPGYIYDKGDRGVSLSLGFTLPLFHGSQAAINEALAARAKAAAQFESEQSTALSEIEIAAVRFGAAYAAWREAQSAEAASVQAAEAADKRLALGAADRSDVVAAGLARIVAERATQDALKVVLDALAALETGIQEPIWPPSTLRPERPDLKQTALRQ